DGDALLDFAVGALGQVDGSHAAAADHTPEDVRPASGGRRGVKSASGAGGDVSGERAIVRRVVAEQALDLGAHGGVVEAKTGLSFGGREVGELVEKSFDLAGHRRII